MTRRRTRPPAALGGAQSPAALGGTRLPAALGGVLRLAAALACLSPAAAAPPPRSDTPSMSLSLREMQADDAANPGMLAVLDGEALWDTRAGRAGRSCADCHGPLAAMRGVAARYPAWNPATGAPIDLAGQIERCRAERQGAGPLASESPERLALTAAVAHQSRGLPIAPSSGPAMAAARTRGRALFMSRMGQLNLACANCHDDNAGRHLAGALIPQAHPVGDPVYRLEWQSVGSLQRRLRSCMAGVRAEPFAYGAPELIDIEAYLKERAAGLPVETPAVRP